MKEKPSEWIAISDLMAGAMAVVVLLLVVAVLQKGVNALRYQEELSRLGEHKNDPVEKVAAALQNVLSKQGGVDLLVMDLPNKRLTLRDGVFERGSACLTVDAKNSVAGVQSHIANFLIQNSNARILVEGYTDNIPVKSPVTDYQRFCTVYDDNFTLSAARAREARKGLVGALDEKIAKRIVVAGYGDSRPLPGVDPSDARNRRVEVRFVID